MTVTIISGKTMEFDHVWVKCPIVDLSKEHQKAVVEKIKKETSVKDERLTLSDFYCAGGRKWVPGSAEDKHFVTRDGNLEILNEKPEDQNLIISREEAERILIACNDHVVWADAYENENRRYWLAGKNAFADGHDRLNKWGAWRSLTAERVAGQEDYAADADIQMLVHDFYFHGGKEGVLKYYDEELSKIEIPQYAEYYERQKKGWETGLWKDDPADPEYVKKNYIDTVRHFVHKMDSFEKKREFMRTNAWTDLWRIVNIPTDEGGEKSDDAYYSPLGNGQIKPEDDLRAWLQQNFISQSKAAELCGVSVRTFRRWLADRLPIPKGSLALLKSKIRPED